MIEKGLETRFSERGREHLRAQLAAMLKLAWRMGEYNHDRPHSFLGYRSPEAYAATCTH